MTKLWRVMCKEDRYPGMWQRWYKNQCVAAGWPPGDGCKLYGKSPGGRSWSAARNTLQEMNIGDYVVVALRGKRVGRLGTITGKAIEDDEWNPLVPVIKPHLPHGEVGRRVLVRWDLTVGPDNQDWIVQLPDRISLGGGRLAMSCIESITVDALREEMNDPENWVSLISSFKHEKTLSDYIATYPNRLEDGLSPYPNSKIQEVVFNDKTRLDVLLIDKQNRPVIVECKQNAPTVQDINQLRHYMSLFMAETEETHRGILVHGGAAKLSSEVLSEARKEPFVEIVSYRLDVNFRPSLILVDI